MPISNNTDEKVGVEVSGPKGSLSRKIGALATTGAGMAGVVYGLVCSDPILTIVGGAITLVGGVCLWRIKREARTIKPDSRCRVLEPCEELAEPTHFANRSVKFRQVDAGGVCGDQIAEISFDTEGYTVANHRDPWVSRTVTGLEPMLRHPLRVVLHETASMAHDIRVNTV